jgi:L-threonylcarbamoyladenylate synthase
MRAADAAAITEAAAILVRGGLVAFPTETVYGLGANAEDVDALVRLFAAKDRPRINPLIIHLRNVEEAATNAFFNPLARKLAEAFWPGALTLVLPRRSNSRVALLASAGLDTLALRVPAHPVAASLLAKTGLPVAAPSANPSGRLSATRAEHVAAELGQHVDFILDGGSVPIGLESTVIGFENDSPVQFRAGAIPRDAIERVAGRMAMAQVDNLVRSPGQLRSHYAPRAQLRLNARDVSDGEALLGFGGLVPAGAVWTLNLSVNGNLKEAAANLFTMLRALDATGAHTIAVMTLPSTGLGEAINDRLLRAAAPRQGAP